MIRFLVAAALGLPVAQAVLVWVGALLGGMGDERGAEIVRSVGTVCLVLWTITLVALLILVAVVVGNEATPERTGERLEPEDEL
jgi:hypothetical protein